jgi:hypothetical protein
VGNRRGYQAPINQAARDQETQAVYASFASNLEAEHYANLYILWHEDDVLTQKPQMADPLSAGASVLAFGALGPFAVQAGKTSVGLYNQFKVAEREVAHILSRLEHFKEYIEGVTSRCAAADSHSKSSQTLLTEAQDIVKCLDELLRQYKQRLRKRDRLKLVLKDQEKAERLQTKLGTILSSIKHQETM